MTISVNQQVDFLWKKLGFGLTKTDVPSLKDATNESILSAPFLPGDRIWTESNLIPNVLPTDSAGVVEVWSTTSGPVHCTMDITATANRTWLTNLKDWVPIEFGSTYQIKVFLAPEMSSDPIADGIQLWAAGTNNDDEWFFDYESGVLHFIGNNLPAHDFTGNIIFIYGGRYVGVKGLGNLTSGTFGDITIAGNSITSSVGTITFNACSGAYFGGAVIHDIGYPSLPTDAASMQFVTESIASLHPNAIWQDDSIVSITDTGAGGELGITIDGTKISSFTSIGANIANLQISGSSISSSGDLLLTPSAGNVIVANTTAAFQVPVGTTLERPATPDIGFVRFNTTAGVLECFDGTNWNNSQSSIATQLLVGTGVNASFSLIQPSSAANLLVITNGVVQLPNVAYTVVGSTITFAEIPQMTDLIEIRFISLSVSPTATMSNATVIDGSMITVGTTPVPIDSFSFGVYRAAKYTLTVTYVDGNSQMAEVMVSHNGVLGALYSVDVQHNVTLTPVTGSSLAGITFNTYAWAGLCVLTGSTSTNGTQIKFAKTYFTI